MNALYMLRFAVDYILCLTKGNRYCSHRSYLLMRKLYRLSRGESSKILAAPFEMLYRTKENKSTDKLDILCPHVEELERQGFSRISHSPLSVSLCNQIHEELSRKTVHEMVPSGCTGKIWDSAKMAIEYSSRSPRLNHQRWDVMRDKKVWSLMHELSLHRLAAYYLRCLPVLTSIESWHVNPIGDQRDSEVLYSTCAQTYHYDMDWIRFLKVFVNLTRSDRASGAFEFVVGTHICRAHDDYTDKRIEDFKIQSSKVVYADGVTGDAFLVDTSGIHRDGRAKNRSRHVLQYEFAVAAFGASKLYSDSISKSSGLIPWDYVETLFPRDSRLLSLYSQ